MYIAMKREKGNDDDDDDDDELNRLGEKQIGAQNATGAGEEEEASICFVFESVFFLIKNDVFTSLSSSIALFIRQHRQRYDYIENSTQKKREERRKFACYFSLSFVRSFDFVWIGSMSHHCSLNCYFSLGLAQIN